MRSERKIQVLAALVAAASLAVSASLSTAVSAEAGRAQLGYGDRAEDSDPPEVALGIALGAFRGLFVNLLWLRAESLKREGKFYESIELSRAITRLQPRFPRVWSFQAWNMAYNISVGTRSPDERWQWVKAGVDLLRKEGIPKNPSDALLHKEIAWIYNHKIQGYSDDANQYYKRRVAEEWTIALGPPPPRTGTREQNTRLYIAWLDGFESAPETMDDAVKAEPRVAELASRIANEARLPLNEKLLRSVELYLAFLNSWAAREGIIGLTEDNRNDALMALIADRSYEKAWQTLLYHLRKRYVTDSLGMEIPRMIRYTEKYGPLDWRHASTHALYWALRGVELGSERVNSKDMDLTNTDRIVLHAVQELARWGDVSYDILNDQSYIALPSTDFIPLYGQILKELEERAGFFEGRDRMFRLYGIGYENFLRDTIRYYYRLGDKEGASKYYEELRTWPGLNLNLKPDLERELAKPLDQFVMDQVKGDEDSQDRRDSPYVAAQEIDGAIRDALIRRIRGDAKAYTGLMQYARAVHDFYREKQYRFTPAGGDRARMEMFPLVFEDAVANTLTGMTVYGRLPVTDAALLYRAQPLAVRQASFDRIAGALVGPSAPFDRETFSRLFPEPENMEQYRALRRLQDQTDDKARLRQLQIERK